MRVTDLTEKKEEDIVVLALREVAKRAEQGKGYSAEAKALALAVVTMALNDHQKRQEDARPRTDDVPEMVLIKEAAAKTGLSYDFIRRGCLQGKIPHIKINRKYLINYGKLLEFLDNGGASDVI